MKTPVTSKADFYRRSRAGEFGNTLMEWFDLDAWKASPWFDRLHFWGVRHSKIAGFPGTRLNVDKADVEDHVRNFGFGSDYQLSPMIWQVGHVQWEGDVTRTADEGLVCCGNVSPEHGSWRTHMKSPRQWSGLAAEVLLRSVLNENSREDLEILLDEYPDHVVELSALDACFGTVPHRNAVVWEVRAY